MKAFIFLVISLILADFMDNFIGINRDGIKWNIHLFVYVFIGALFVSLLK